MLITVLLTLNLILHADEAPFSTTATAWTAFRPYAPEKVDYNFEYGSTFETHSMYWLGFGLGRHIGNCIFSQSNRCQHFLDLNAGAAGRDGETMGIFLASLRWQFVNFPSAVSPSARIFLGDLKISDNTRDKDDFTYGVGFGLTAAVHERVDLKIETRYGFGDHNWGQVFLTMGLKMDRWVDYFAERIKAFGVGTVEATGAVIQAPGRVIDWLGSSKKKDGTDSKK